MSFKVKDLAMHVVLNAEASTCGTWTRTTSGLEGTCEGSFFDGQRGQGRNLSALKAQLRQAVARA
jgi:hypothetical protein